jgi:hypothetical protein
MNADPGAACAAASAAQRPRDRHKVAWDLTEHVQFMDQRRGVMTGHSPVAGDHQGGGDPRRVFTRLGRDQSRRRVCAVAQPEQRAAPDEAAYLARRCPCGCKFGVRHHATDPRDPRTGHLPTIPRVADIPASLPRLTPVRGSLIT